MQVSRRQALQCGGVALGTAFAGCLGTDEASDPETKSPLPTPDCSIDLPSETDDNNQPDEGFHSITAQSDPIDPVHNVAGSIEVVRQYTSDAPAAVRIYFANDGQAREFEFGITPPVSSYHGTHTDEDAHLVLYPETDAAVGLVDPETGDDVPVPEEPTDGCWALDGELLVGDALTKRQLEPCETISESYRVFASGENENCLAPGTYSFKESRFGDAGVEFAFEITVF